MDPHPKMKSSLADLDGEVSQEILKASVNRTYNAAEQVFCEGEKATFLPIILTGSVKLVRFPEVGKEVILGVFQAGDIFAVPPALDGKQFPATAIAMEKTELLMLPRAEFLRLIGSSREFSAMIMDRMCGILRDRADVLQVLATPSAERRVAIVLLKLAGEVNGQQATKVTQRRQDIAEMAGLTTETTIRAIRKLADRGVLEIIRGKIVLNSTENLRVFIG